MSSTDTIRARTSQGRLGRLALHTVGLGLLSLSVGCSSDKGGESSPPGAGASGAPLVTSAGAGGTSAGAPSQGGSAGAVAQAGAANAGTSSGGASGAGAGAGAGAGTAGQTSAGGGANGACAFQCVNQCVEAGGTEKDGTCAGTQICCDGATSTPVNPLAHLVASAQDVGVLLANRFSKQALSFTAKNMPGDGYKVVCEWYGALGVAKSTSNQTLLDALVKKFDPVKSTFVADMTGGEAHVDRYIFGMVPLEIYLQTGDASYLPLGTQVADKQQNPSQTRGAIDDMFMMTGLQLEAYRATKKASGETAAAKYTNYMAPVMVDYLKAQKTNGLFFHNDKEGPVHWGRGNGWFAAGMAEMLKDLPKNDARYATIEAGYKKMMEGLLPLQSKNGLWYQVLDMPNDAKNWEETSGSAMFTYAMIVGVRRGVLDAAKYVPVIDAAWAGVKKKIAANGDVSDICIGTWYKANAQEYMALTKLTGDGHGQAPVLWAAAELLR